MNTETLVHDLISTQFVRTLKGMRHQLILAQDHAKARDFDDKLFLEMRLAPDMLTLGAQVQICTDNAKGAVARLSGKTAPIYEDNEKTMAELIARVEKTISHLQSFKAEDFKDFETKIAKFPWNPDMQLSGYDYLVSMAIPNFFFHATTTYALIRHAGVKIGKTDFLGEVNWKK